jgi:hypothetical protein
MTIIAPFIPSDLFTYSADSRMFVGEASTIQGNGHDAATRPRLREEPEAMNNDLWPRVYLCPVCGTKSNASVHCPLPPKEPPPPALVSYEDGPGGRITLSFQIKVF